MAVWHRQTPLANFHAETHRFDTRNCRDIVRLCGDRAYGGNQGKSRGIEAHVKHGLIRKCVIASYPPGQRVHKTFETPRLNRMLQQTLVIG